MSTDEKKAVRAKCILYHCKEIIHLNKRRLIVRALTFCSIVIFLLSATGCAPKFYTLTGGNAKSPVSEVALLKTGKCINAIGNTPFLLELDGTPGPNGLGLAFGNISVYNSGTSGKFIVELAPGEHTIVGAYGKTGSSIALTGALFAWSKKPTKVQFSVAPGKSYLLMASPEKVWVEEEKN